MLVYFDRPLYMSSTSPLVSLYSPVQFVEDKFVFKHYARIDNMNFISHTHTHTHTHTHQHTNAPTHTHVCVHSICTCINK